MFDYQCRAIGLGHALQTDSHVSCLYSLIIGLCEWLPVDSERRDNGHVVSMGRLVRLVVVVIRGGREA